MAWTPTQDTRAMTAQEFLQYAEREIPGISTNPELKPYLGLLQATLEQMDPVRIRARARLRGMAPALTRQQHIEVVKAGVRRTPKQAAAAVDARTNPVAVLRHLRRLRRNNSEGSGEGWVPVQSVDPTQVWQYFTTNTYSSKDLPLLAVREALQNSVDAIRKAVKLGQIKKGEGLFEVIVDRNRKSLTFRDNGTGMDKSILQVFLTIAKSPKRDEAIRSGELNATIDLKVRKYKRGMETGNGAFYVRLNGLLQFIKKKDPYSDNPLKEDYLLDYTTSGATGGFGVAKAVILGCSTTFDWDLRTQTFLMTGQQVKEGALVQTGLPYFRGVELTVYNLDYFDYAPGDYRSIEDRIRNLLALNDLPDITLTLNGEEVTPYFTGRRGTLMPENADITDETGQIVRAYDLTELRGGSGVPGTAAYPFNLGRDRFNSETTEYAFDKFRAFCQKPEPKKVEPEDEIHDPRSSKAKPGYEEIKEQVAKILDDDTVKALVQTGAKVARDFRKAQEKDSELKAEAKFKARGHEQKAEERAGIGPSSYVPPEVTPTKKAMDAAVDREVEIKEAEQKQVDPEEIFQSKLMVLSNYLSAYYELAGAKYYDRQHVGACVRLLRDWAGFGWFGNYERVSYYEVKDLYDALDVIQKNAAKPGVGGINFVLSIEAALEDVLRDLVAARKVSKLDIDEVKRTRLSGNPFGAFAGLYIRRKGFLNREGKYNSAGVIKFKKNYAKYLPALVLWDQLLRMVMDTYGQVDKDIYPGFVLDDDAVAMYIPQIATIAVNPFFFKQAKESYNNSRDLAAYLHGLICHELAHAIQGVGHGGQDGHNEAFSITREDIAFNTYSLIPAFSRLLSEVLGISDPDRQAVQTAEQKLRQELKVTQSCPKCYQQLIETLEQDGRLDTIEWLKRA